MPNFIHIEGMYIKRTYAVMLRSYITIYTKLSSYHSLDRVRKRSCTIFRLWLATRIWPYSHFAGRRYYSHNAACANYLTEFDFIAPRCGYSLNRCRISSLVALLHCILLHICLVGKLKIYPTLNLN